MKKVLYLILFCVSSISLSAQNDFFKNPPITFSIYSHSIGVPFKEIIKTPLNLGFAIGTEFSYYQKPNSSLHQRVEIGWYHHKNLQTGLWIKTDLVRRFTSTNGYFGEIQVSAGYIKDFNAYETFELVKGAYAKKNKANKGGFLGGIGLGGGYQFMVKDKYILAPFVRYEGLLQLPYSDFQPFLPHSLLHLGTRFQVIR